MKSTSPPLDGDDFFNRLEREAGAEGRAVHAMLELSYDCNLSCVHCYIPKSFRGGKGGRLTVGDYENLFDEMREAGILLVTFTGGEPLACKDFKEIYLLAKRKGFLVDVKTNATLVTQDLADFLAEYPPRTVIASFYGLTPETYERVTGAAGSFKKFMEGLKLLKSKGIEVVVTIPFMTLNEAEITGMVEFARREKIPFAVNYLIDKRLDGDGEPTKLRLAPERVVELLERIYGKEKLLPTEKDRSHIPADALFWTCRRSRAGFTLDPHGNMSLCFGLRKPTYSVREHGVAGAWGKLVEMMDSETYKSDTKCLSCELRWMCRQCPCRAQLEHGDRERVVDYLCELTRLRAVTCGDCSV